MTKLGKYNTLKAVKELDFGMYLDGGEEFGEILLPTKYSPILYEKIVTFFDNLFNFFYLFFYYSFYFF